MSNEPDPILDHTYDDIAEMDNKLPRWWVWLFKLSIAFAFLYLMFFHILKIGDSSAALYRKEILAAKGEPAPAPADGSAVTAAPEEQPSTDEATLARGKEVFKANCTVCHGQNAEGLIGPNLCDDYWLHGPRFADNLHTIREGVLAKGMISWKAILKPADIQAVGSYIYTLRGSNPPNPKPPEGVKADS